LELKLVASVTSGQGGRAEKPCKHGAKGLCTAHATAGTIPLLEISIESGAIQLTLPGLLRRARDMPSRPLFSEWKKSA
jgi:hypothetical protein